jgi:hypothetical protein
MSEDQRHCSCGCKRQVDRSPDPAEEDDGPGQPREEDDPRDSRIASCVTRHIALPGPARLRMTVAAPPPEAVGLLMVSWSPEIV